MLKEFSVCVDTNKFVFNTAMNGQTIRWSPVFSWTVKKDGSLITSRNSLLKKLLNISCDTIQVNTLTFLACLFSGFTTV